jgi:hypothetical protein
MARTGVPLRAPNGTFPRANQNPKSTGRKGTGSGTPATIMRKPAAAPATDGAKCPAVRLTSS